MFPVNIVLSQWPLSGCVTLEFTQASHWAPCEHCDVGCVSWLPLFRIVHDCICSAQFGIAHLEGVLTKYFPCARSCTNGNHRCPVWLRVE